MRCPPLSAPPAASPGSLLRGEFGCSAHSPWGLGSGGGRVSGAVESMEGLWGKLSWEGCLGCLFEVVWGCCFGWVKEILRVLSTE